MKRLFFLTFIFFGCSVLTPLQKSRFIAVFHLIENASYEEAKEVVEDMISHEEYAQWPRTWYARGLLCQTAYREGVRVNNRKMYELYPNQLYVAFDSYEKALSLDTRGSIQKQLAPRYVLLANDFQKLGGKHYNDGEYKESLRAFENALKVTQSPILTVQTDTNLIYNTALAAFQSKERETAVRHLSRLHGYNHSTNVTHLLFSTYLEKGDTVSAKKVLKEGIDSYEENKDLILLLADLHFKQGNPEKSLDVLVSASLENPSKHIFPFTKGLIYQKTEQYRKAIGVYKQAFALAPGELLTHVNMATCYYNIGVEIEESSRSINNKGQVLDEKQRSTAAFDAAVEWLNKAYNQKPDNPLVIDKMQGLLERLNMSDRTNGMEDGTDHTNND